MKQTENRFHQFRFGKRKHGDIQSYSQQPRQQQQQQQQQQPPPRSQPTVSIPPTVQSDHSTVEFPSLNRAQMYALRHVGLGENVAIMGSGGTGKSFLIRQILHEFPVEGTHVTSSTGMTAIALDGITVHSCLGIGIGDKSVEEYAQRIQQNYRLASRWRRMRRLIMDELSLISGALFDKMESLARLLKKSEKPFGGIQLVVCFDALQLPPVSDSNDFVFCARSWSRCFAIRNHVELTRVIRQSDVAFVEMLQRIRKGEPTSEDIALLNTRVRAVEDNVKESQIDMFSLRRSVEEMNVRCLQRLQGDVHTFVARDHAEKDERDDCCEGGGGGGGGGSRNGEMLQKSCPAPLQLHLKQGARVMLLRNVNMQERLANGSVGTVVGFERCVDKHDLLSSSDMQRYVQDPTFRQYVMSQQWPIVMFSDGKTRTVYPCVWEIKCDDRVLAARIQCPLVLAYATTIHKTQGMTLDQAYIHLDRIFEAGQFYVAVSRIRSLAGITFDRPVQMSMIQAHPVALEFYRRLSDLQQQQQQQQSNECL